MQGRWEKATATLDRAATLNPRNPELLVSLSNNYELRRLYRDDERILERLIELEPHQPWIRLRKAMCAFYEKADLRAVRAACEAARMFAYETVDQRARGFLPGGEDDSPA